jgi:hypothetical protein
MDEKGKVVHRVRLAIYDLFLFMLIALICQVISASHASASSFDTSNALVEITFDSSDATLYMDLTHLGTLPLSQNTHTHTQKQTPKQAHLTHLHTFLTLSLFIYSLMPLPASQ